MSDPSTPPPTPIDPADVESEVERLSKELKQQARWAKERISERYERLVEDRPFEKPGPGED